jgi:trehalose/maltose hydrolase-like predicted phosphorylase
MTDRWCLTESAFSPDTARAYEGLFTLGSGYLHVRGSLEEHLSDAPQNVSFTRLPANVTSEKFVAAKAKWGTYVPGLFGAHPLLNHEMINLPWFLGLVPIVDGERLDVERCAVEGYDRTLDFHTATLERSLTWRTRSGATVAVTFARFISAARPQLSVQRVTVTADRPVMLEIVAGIDADVRTNGFDHFTAVQMAGAGGDGLVCAVATDRGEQVAVHCQLRAPGVVWATALTERAGSCRGEIRLSAGEPLTVEKYTVVTSSRDLTPVEAVPALDAALAQGWEALHAEHAATWAARWAACDVVVEGDPSAQLALRCSLYHLLRAHVPGDPRVAIDAKGYAGEAYWGRFFWDTEMYLLPFFLYTQPELARTLVDFRVHALPGAQANAAAYGYPGARYPWESDGDGIECCPNWQYRDHEVHVTADVAYAMAHYAKALPAPGYLWGAPARVLVETARYWLARIDWRPGEGFPSLLGVMGPDEYVPISSNNAYTNRLVAFALALAAEVGEAGGATADERAEFARVAQLLPVPTTADGLVLQCEEFFHLADPRFAERWLDRTKTFAAQVSQELLYRSKCLKQADVLMLMMLFPGEFSEAQVRQAWEAYVPFTTHDSSLSAGAHAIVGLRLGLTAEAWACWERSAEQDLDLAHGGAAEGVHIASAAANWQIAVFGFAGLVSALWTDTLTLYPQLPTAWTRLAFPLVWQGTPVHIEIQAGECAVTNRGQAALLVQVWGQEVSLAAGAVAHFTESAVRVTPACRRGGC